MRIEDIQNTKLNMENKMNKLEEQKLKDDKQIKNLNDKIIEYQNEISIVTDQFNNQNKDQYGIILANEKEKEELKNNIKLLESNHNTEINEILKNHKLELGSLMNNLDEINNK